MKKIYALFMTLCLVISATAAPLVGTVKKSYPLNEKEVVSEKQLSLGLSMKKAPAATQGMQYDATEGELIRYYNESDALTIDTTYASEGQLSVRLVASDRSDMLSLVLFAESTVPGTIIPEGTYPITSEPAYGTAYASPGVQNGSVYPSFYGMLNANGQILTPLYFLESGNVVVEAVNGNLKISIDAANSNNVPMTIVYEVGGKSEKVEVKGPLKYDATEGALDVTYGADATVQLTNGDGYSILTVASPDATNEVDLAFFYDAVDPETVIPAGTYTIDDSYTSGTVLASSGVNSQGQVSLSFYANLDEEGYLMTPLYFLVGGTVEVTNVDGNLKVEVNGVNSNDLPIHIVYDATPAAPDYEIMPIEMTNLEVQDMGEFVLLQASDLNMTGISVMLGVYADGHLHEGSAVDWNGTELPIVEGNITKTVDEEKGDVYSGLVVVEFGEGKMGLNLTMYSAAVEAVEVFVSGAEVEIVEATGTLQFTATWEGYPVLVTVAGYEEAEFKEYEGAQISELTIGDDYNWYDFAVADAVAVFKDGNVFSIEGEYTSWATGATYYVMIDGELPAVVDPVKPEPTYTENNLNPYAFGLESVLAEDALVVTYRLNNSNATSVNVVVYNGDEVVATVPGTTTIGVNTVEVATAELPTDVELTWAVEVNGTSVEVPTREEKIYSFYHPSGLDIDNNPENATFGMLIINEGMQSVASKTEGYVSAGFGAGIFAFTPSFDLIPNGELPGYNGGIEFTTTRADGTGTAYAPRRVRISEDGRIFVTSLNTDGNYLWEVNPDNLDEWTTVFSGELNDNKELVDAEGNFVAAPNNGFDVKGAGENLQLAMYSVNLPGITAAAMSGFRLHEYNLGTATTWATAPSKTWVEGLYAINYTGTQVEYDNEGGLWIASYRGTASDANPGLVHINADGVEDLKLVWNNVRQAGIRFNNDFTKLVVAGNNGAAKKATIYAVSKDENGAPVLTEETVIDMAVVGNNLNDFAWDYAGNLYSCGNSSEKLAAWAMPYAGQVVTPAAAQYAFELEAAPAVEVMELTMTNLSVQNYGDATGLWASDMDNGIEVMLFLDADGNLMEESSIMVSWMDYPVTGTVTKSYNEELATDVYVAELYTTVGETNYKLIITMYYVPVEATPVVVENATIDDQTETSGFMYMYGEWTDADGLVYPVSAEVPGFDATVAEAVYSNVTVTVGGWGDDDPWLGFVQGDATITVVDDVVTLVGTMSSWDGLVLDVTISGTLPAVVEPVEMVGVVKRTLFNGYDVIVLTHEEDGTAHIYNIVEGDVLEVSQEGVIAVDPENAGDFLAISDIALTEDGKLVATNYMVTQSDDTRVDAGYKRGETRIYIWNDLAGDPSILFTSKMSSNWFRSKQGLTMAVKGTSDNMEIFMTGIHATSAWARVSSYRVIDGVYEEPAVNHNDHYYFYDVADAVALETTVGTQYELNASPLGDMNWILDANLIDPVEIVEPETNNVEIASCVALNEDLGKKYNGASYITVGEQVYMVAPFATPDGVLTSVEVLDITNGLDAAQYVDQLFIDEPVAATAAATAVTVVENTLAIALVADANYYMLELPLGNEPGGDYEVYEDEITNLVIDYDNMLLIGGPSTSFQVEVVLGLGDYDRNTDTYQLLPGSSISVLGAEATFIDGYASVDGIEQTALAVVHCTWNDMALEFHLTMSAAPLEATVVVVENATIEIEKYLLWGDMYDYSLKMSGVWSNPEDGVDYPVLVEVPVYYPESTEPSIIYSTVTVGGMGDEDPWFGFGEGDLTITTVGDFITATGIVQNPYAGIAIDITISGSITSVPDGLDNVEVEVKAVKMIKNGQLIINKDGKEFNAQGAILK